MTRVCAKFIPKLLSDHLRLEIAQDNLEMIHSDENFLKKIITGDETWVYGYDPETKQQSSQWKFPSEPRPKKARQSRSNIKRKRPQLWESGDWLVHHDNAPAHTSNLVQQYLSKHNIAQLRQPPYSPDIAPCDFWLFPRLKMPLNGHRFDNKQTVETNATNALKAISKTDFQECFNKWKHRYEQLVQSNGNYFEGCHPPDDEE
ncbi:histone-lysine n-methyltransferase setmar-like protein [Trichonephila clavipes]|nr:histone-lysine n-methyltransferase setmar-like protein [Trichonephila clavipes]